VAVAKDARVVIDGREGKLTDLRRGMQVSLVMAKGGPAAARVEASTTGGAVLKAADAEKRAITLQVRGREWIAPLARDAVITVAGKQGAKLSDLKPGMRLSVQLGVEADRIVAKVVLAYSE
jgi:hypothetical protein